MTFKMPKAGKIRYAGETIKPRRRKGKPTAMDKIAKLNKRKK